MMNLHPLGVKRTWHIDSNNADVRAHVRNRDLVLIAVGRCLGISLSHRVLADDFEHQVSALVAMVSGVQQILELGIHFEPPVGVSVCFVRVLENELVLEELKQQSVHCFRFLMLHPVGSLREIRELCGVTVLKTVLCHLGKEKHVLFAP